MRVCAHAHTYTHKHPNTPPCKYLYTSTLTHINAHKTNNNIPDDSLAMNQEKHIKDKNMAAEVDRTAIRGKALRTSIVYLYQAPKG